MVLTFQKVANAFEKFERHLVDPVLVGGLEKKSQKFHQKILFHI